MSRTAEIFRNEFRDQSTEGILRICLDALSFVKGSNKRLGLMCVQTIEPSKSFAFSLRFRNDRIAAAIINTF